MPDLNQQCFVKSFTFRQRCCCKKPQNKKTFLWKNILKTHTKYLLATHKQNDKMLNTLRIDTLLEITTRSIDNLARFQREREKHLKVLRIGPGSANSNTWNPPLLPSPLRAKSSKCRFRVTHSYTVTRGIQNTVTQWRWIQNTGITSKHSKPWN